MLKSTYSNWGKYFFLVFFLLCNLVFQNLIAQAKHTKIMPKEIKPKADKAKMLVGKSNNKVTDKKVNKAENIVVSKGKIPANKYNNKTTHKKVNKAGNKAKAMGYVSKETELIRRSQEDTAKKDSVKSYLDQMGRKLTRNTWGISMLFSGKAATNSDVDLIFAGVDYFSQQSFNIRASLSYFFRDNMSAGLSVTYQQDKYKLQANILQNFLSRDIQNFSRQFSINPFIKNYVPLSSRNIIYITNQTELIYELASGVYNTPVNRDPGSSIPIPGQPAPAQVLQNKLSRIQLLGFGIRPGILVFFTPHFAFESTVGIFSFAYKTEQLSYNYPKGEPDKSMRKANVTNTSFGFDFKLNVLKFGFGFSYYF